MERAGTPTMTLIFGVSGLELLLTYPFLVRLKVEVNETEIFSNYPKDLDQPIEE